MHATIRQGAEALLLTLWVGSLWAIGYVAAPVLFARLDDRALAGTLAGQMFTAVAWIGLVAGSMLLLANIVYRGSTGKWRSLVLIGMLVLVATGHFILQPMMAELRMSGIPEGSESAGEFARLHGLAAVLYLLTSLLGLVLVVAGTRPDGAITE